MVTKFKLRIAETLAAFHADTRGIALTEYVLLMAVLVGGVVMTVSAFGDSLGDTWQAYASWLRAAGPSSPTS